MSEASITGVLIPMKIDTPIRRVQIDVRGADPIAELVGGEPKAHLWEGVSNVVAYTRNGAEHDQSINRLATALLEGTGRLREDEYIAGPYLILGQDDEGLCSLSPELLTELAPVELVIRIPIGVGETMNFYAAADLARQTAAKIMDTGPFSGAGKHPSGELAVEWTFR